MTGDHWFADVADDPTPGFRWQPFLQNGGSCLPLPLWFPTEDECDRFIATIPAGGQTG